MGGKGPCEAVWAQAVWGYGHRRYGGMGTGGMGMGTGGMGMGTGTGGMGTGGMGTGVWAQGYGHRGMDTGGMGMVHEGKGQLLSCSFSSSWFCYSPILSFLNLPNLYNTNSQDTYDISGKVRRLEVTSHVNAGELT